MFVHTVEYVDFNGSDRKEKLHFHLSLPEVTRLEAEIGMPIIEYVKDLNNNQKTNDLLMFLERMILNAYGQKTSDGRSFHKTQAIRDEFENSQAYAEFFEQVITVPDLSRKFGEGVSATGKKRNQVAPKLVENDQPEQ